MAEATPSRPQAVLFACGLNSVRSPMAAALLRQMGGAPLGGTPLGGTPLYVASAGVRAAELDPFAAAAMAEIGIDISAHRPITFEELEDLEGLNFDLIVTLSPEAHHKALALTHRLAAQVEYWPTADPADVEGNRAQRLDAYRAVRDQLTQRIRSRFFARPA
jgi:protein-tyrosine-phosphatase